MNIILRDYNAPKNDEDYVYVSQLLQAKGVVMGIEAHRRAKPYQYGNFILAIKRLLASNFLVEYRLFR